MDFIAEIVRTQQSKTYSGLDQNYTLLLRTNNPLILDLGKLPALTTVKVSIDLVERVHEKGQDKFVKLMTPKRATIKLPKRKKLELKKA